MRRMAFMCLTVAGLSACNPAKSTSAPLSETGERATPPIQSIADARPIMRAKLAHAQGVLQALALEDFDAIASQAYSLAMLSKEADWQIHKTLPYIHYSEAFRKVCVSISHHAEKRDLHGVALDYLEMTMTCVKCHSYMRHEGLTDAGGTDPLASLGVR